MCWMSIKRFHVCACACTTGRQRNSAAICRASVSCCPCCSHSPEPCCQFSAAHCKQDGGVHSSRLAEQVLVQGNKVGCLLLYLQNGIDPKMHTAKFGGATCICRLQNMLNMNCAQGCVGREVQFRAPSCTAEGTHPSLDIIGVLQRRAVRGPAIAQEVIALVLQKVQQDVG